MNGEEKKENSEALKLQILLLKNWEKDFQEKHAGRKPTTEDIIRCGMSKYPILFHFNFFLKGSEYKKYNQLKNTNANVNTPSKTNLLDSPLLYRYKNQ